MDGEIQEGSGLGGMMVYVCSNANIAYNLDTMIPEPGIRQGRDSGDEVGQQRIL